MRDRNNKKIENQKKKNEATTCEREQVRTAKEIETETKTKDKNELAKGEK